MQKPYMSRVHFPIYMPKAALKSGLLSAIFNKVPCACGFILSACCMNLKLWISWNVDDGTRSTILALIN